MNTPHQNTHLPLPRRIWWPWNETAGWVGFWQTFNTPHPISGQLFISASGFYRVWLDNEEIKPPSTPLPSWRSMHNIPVVLPPGDHLLQFEAQTGGHSQPFLMVCLDWKENGGLNRVASGPQWMMIREPRLGWLPRQDQNECRHAWAFDGPWAEPWGMPCNAPIDFCRLSTGWQQVDSQVLTRVTGFFSGLPTAGGAAQLLVGGAISLLPPKPHAHHIPVIENTRSRLEWYRTREAHSLILNTWLDLFEPRVPHVVLDCGQETFARLRVTVRSGGPAILAITTGESINEVHRYARRVTDIFEIKDGQSFTTAPTGFRFVKIMALSATGTGDEVIIEPVIAEHIRYPLTRRGTFQCSDPLLNEVWDLSSLTTHLCMQNEIWDGIKRDQLPWMGDLYTEALAIYTLFGDYKLPRHTLSVLAEIGPAKAKPLESQLYPGLTAIWKSGASSHPGADSGDINGIPSYTLWWIIGLADYVRFSGDKTLIQQIGDDLEQVLTHIYSWINLDHIWQFHGGWDFIDWAPVVQKEREIYCHLLAYQALKLGAALLEMIGRPFSEYQYTYQHMEQATRSLWPEAAGFGHSHHVNAMAIRSGIFTPDQNADLFNKTLASDPQLSMTYWHRYLDLEAAAQTGQIQWGLDYIRKHWGLSLQLGLTTLWEAFDPAWIGPDPHAVSMVGAEYARYGGYETSLCHGWSAGPAVWLHQAILGIRPASPGFACVDFKPDLGDLAWAQGKVLTPNGEIIVSLSRGKQVKSQAKLIVPPEIKICFAEELAENWEIEIQQ